MECKEVLGGGGWLKLELRLMVGSDNGSNGPLGQRPPPALIHRSALADIQHHIKLLNSQNRSEIGGGKSEVDENGK